MSDQLLDLIASAAVKDDDIKKALVDYIKAKTAKEQPAESWQEVWYDTTHEPRIYPELDDIDRYSGNTDTKKYAYVFTRVQYSSTHRVVKVTAFLSHEPFTTRKIAYMMDTFDYINPFYTAAQEVEDYRDAVLYGQAVWPIVLEKFEAVTKPVKEMA